MLLKNGVTFSGKVINKLVYHRFRGFCLYLSGLSINNRKRLTPSRYFSNRYIHYTLIFRKTVIERNGFSKRVKKVYLLTNITLNILELSPGDCPTQFTIALPESFALISTMQTRLALALSESVIMPVMNPVSG